MTVSEAESVRESVYQILMTQQGERLTRPAFGSNLLSYTFMDMSNGPIALMIRDLTETLRQHEPRIDRIEINAEPSPRQGVLIITIDYMLRATNTKDNLVFPFYLNAAVEQEEEEPEYYEPEIVEEV